MAAAAEPLHNSSDPTATRTLREKEFRPALTTRLRALKGAIRATVGYEQDFFDLRSDARAEVTASAATEERTYELLAAADDIRPTDEGDVQTKRERGAVPAFNEWLSGQLEQGVLEVASGPTVRSGGHYTGRYIRAAAERGWTDGGRRLVRAGADADAIEASFDLPVPQRQLRDLYTQAYRDLQGITQNLEDEIRDELTRGLVEGVHPREMARRLNKRVDVSITWAENLARTQVIKSYNEEALRRYSEAGVEDVAAEVEHLTAGDERVCVVCRSLAGETYTIAEASGRIPVHKNCRCTWIPVLGDTQQATLNRAVS
jgi:SPP1 gp7 family putative phage head morphogenesis protein